MASPTGDRPAGRGRPRTMGPPVPGLSTGDRRAWDASNRAADGAGARPNGRRRTRGIEAMGPTTQLPQVIPIEWLALILLAAVCFLVLVLALVPAPGDPAGGVVSTVAPRAKVRRRACRAFADAVARGDLEEADAMAARALEPAGHGPARQPDPAAPDVIESGRAEAVRRLDGRRAPPVPGSGGDRLLVPGLERVAHDGRVDLVLGPTEPIRLALVSEVWTPDLDGLSFTAACAGFQISGYLTLRTVIARSAPPGGHADGARGLGRHGDHRFPGGRRALARTHGVVHDGLGRMAAELNPV